MKKCMEYRVEGRRPVGRPRKTWLESVEADMAKLEIDKEDVHDRSKWRRNVNVNTCLCSCDEDWVKKCMEYRVEGRRPVGRPRKTWLESVEADMAKLEIDKEDVHDRSKWRRNVNVMKRKSNPIGKQTINR